MSDSIVLAVLGLALALQNVGQTRFDTKLDLLVDPWGFLARSLNAWDPTAGFGQVQNQAYGYLFPMGPFFGVLHTAGVPTWVQQWLWSWLLLAVAYLGVRLLAVRLGLPWWSAVLGGLAYALAPRLVTVLGPLSAEALPAALVPWMLIPLTRTQGSLKRVAFLSAFPVLLMGAANATLTIAALAVPGVWILARAHLRWRLLAWWSAFVIALCTWWIVPLLIQSRYATNFLDFIESARDTTASVGVGEALRGDVHWVAGFFDWGEPWWPAGYAYATTPWVILVTFVLAGIALAGLASRAMPERVACASLVIIGVLILALGSTYAPGHEVWWSALDGVLAPFRNVHKFEPILRLPLALGVAAAAVAISGALARRRPQDPARRARIATAAAIGVVVVAVGMPLVTPGIAAGRTWTAMPSWWLQTTDWLKQTDPQARALVVPGSGFGRYLWGRTIDEPMQAVGSTPWVIDSDLPLGSIGSARVLDSISEVLRQGRPAPGLADVLARSGIRFVVVRNDIAIGPSLAPPRSTVTATLQRTPGLRLSATFGQFADWGNPLTVLDFERDGPRPAIEIYEVEQEVPVAAVAPLVTTAVMTGGPEALLPASAAGLLAASTPTIFAADGPPAAARGPVILTDSLQRRDRALSRGSDAMSAVQTADEPSRLKRRAKDLVPFTSPQFTVAVLDGVASITASTSLAFADAFGPLRPDRQPFAAFDGNPETWWQSAVLTGPEGEWIEVGFLAPRDVTGAQIRLVNSPLVGSSVTKVLLDTGRMSWVMDVEPGGMIGPLSDPGFASVDRLRITALESEGDAGNFAVREVSLPGLAVFRPLRTPPPPAADGRNTAVLLTATEPSRAACVIADEQVRCDPTQLSPDADGGILDRIVQVGSDVVGEIRIAGQVTPGPAASDLYSPLGSGVRATATSWLGQDIHVRPSTAIDGDPATAWVADPFDLRPSLSLDWGTPRTISAVRLVAKQSGQLFSFPLTVRIQAGESSYEADVGPGGLVRFPEVVADSVRIEIKRWSPVTSIDSDTGTANRMPVAVAEVEVYGTGDLVYRPDPQALSGSACGLGPTLIIDGRSYQTRVDATLGGILRGEDVDVIPCGASTVTLTPGDHRISILPSDLVEPVRVAITPGSAVTGVSAAPEPRILEVVQWGTSQRTLTVGPGDASILRVAESANSGWDAELDGIPLERSRIDGWQQAWIVPAGAGGTITLTFGPSRWQVLGMLLGALVAIGAVILGVSTAFTRRRLDLEPVGPWHPAAAGAVGVVTAGLLLGPVGLLAGGLAAWVRRFGVAPALSALALLSAGVGSVVGMPYLLGEGCAVFGCAVAAITALSSPRDR